MFQQANVCKFVSAGRAWQVALPSLSLPGLVARRSGNTLCSINEVALHLAGLVLGWVTACGQINHLRMQTTA